MELSIHHHKPAYFVAHTRLLLSFLKDWAVKTAVACFLLGASGAIQADVFKEMMEMRYGATLFHDKRFADAEIVFERLHQHLIDTQSNDLHRLSTVINFLAQSKSFQGKSEEALLLQQRRVEIGEDIFGESSPELGPLLSGVAEAHFRLGNRDQALQHATVAIEGLKKLGPEHEQHVQLVEVNLERYKTGTFDPDKLPEDLSAFYRNCESILTGDSEFAVDSKMQSFVELDVDFKPTGMWGTLFSIAAQGRDGEARTGNNYRRIFLPSADESMRNEVCVVDQHSGVVVSADNSLE